MILPILIGGAVGFGIGSGIGYGAAVIIKKIVEIKTCKLNLSNDSFSRQKQLDELIKDIRESS